MKKNISFICSVLFFLFCFFNVSFAECQNFDECKVLAEKGDGDAQFNLGLMYHKGQGVAQDYKEAEKWCRLAAEQGDVKAQFNLWDMYYNGQGVAQDYKEAVKWCKLAAEQGYAQAQFNLWKIYYYGKGVVPNCSRAYMWLNICAANGDNDCIKNRDIVAKKMSTQHLAKAQEMAKKCLESNYKNCD